eukprot:971551-Pyramimonas_sp.AAC.1
MQRREEREEGGVKRRNPPQTNPNHAPDRRDRGGYKTPLTLGAQHPICPLVRKGGEWPSTVHELQQRGGDRASVDTAWPRLS